MLSFHNDPAIKAKYLARAIAQRKAGGMTQDEKCKKGKGCVDECTVENHAHCIYPSAIGLPEWLAYFEDVIFQQLSPEDDVLWPERFLAAIPVGVNLEKIRHVLSIKRLNKLIELQLKNKKSSPALEKIISDVIAALDLVKKCHEAELKGDDCDLVTAKNAAILAENAAEFSETPAGMSAAMAAHSALCSATWLVPDAKVCTAIQSQGYAALASVASICWTVAESAQPAAMEASWKQEAEEFLTTLKASAPRVPVPNQSQSSSAFFSDSAQKKKYEELMAKLTAVEHKPEARLPAAAPAAPAPARSIERPDLMRAREMLQRMVVFQVDEDEFIEGLEYFGGYNKSSREAK